MAVAVNPHTPTADGIRDQQWHLASLHIDEAHRSSTGAGIVVGVVDTGVDASHPDLADNVLPGFDFAGLTPGGLGGTDVDGHGTAMAGSIAAHGAALGIAPDSKVLPVRFMALRTPFPNNASPGIDWAVDHGAKVLCLAFGSMNDGVGLKDAIERALARDVVVVAAAGNTTDTSEVTFPAAYPGVVAAVGVDQAGLHASISVEGEQATLSAPAVDIVSTASRSRTAAGYGKGNGTSYAAAIIAGVAALVRAKFPNLSAAEVIHRMTATADDKGPPGRDDQFGYGIVNPVKALTADVPPLTPSAEPTPTQATPPQPDSNGPNRTLIVAGLLGVAALLTAGLVLALRRRG